jgi:hypothetical protein
MERIEPIATALRTQRHRYAATGVSVQAVRGSADTGERRTTPDDVSLVVCFMALVGVLVLGGVLTLFSWVTSALPTTSTVACDAPDGCVLAVPADIQLVRPHDFRIDLPSRVIP